MNKVRILVIGSGPWVVTAVILGVFLKVGMFEDIWMQRAVRTLIITSVVAVLALFYTEVLPRKACPESVRQKLPHGIAMAGVVISGCFFVYWFITRP